MVACFRNSRNGTNALAAQLTGVLIAGLTACGCDSASPSIVAPVGNVQQSSPAEQPVPELAVPDEEHLEPAANLVEAVKEAVSANPVRALPSQPETPTGKQYRAQIRAWLKSVHDKALVRIDNERPAWGAKAETFVAAWVNHAWGDNAARSPQQLADLGKAAIDAGCDEPLVKLYYAQALCLLNTPEARAQARPHIRAVTEALDKATMPRWFVYLGHITCLEAGAAAAEWSVLDEHRRAAIRLAVDALSENVPAGVHRMMHSELGRHLKGPLEPHAAEVLAALAAGPKVDRWMVCILTAEKHLSIGWAARGGGMASTVTQEGWEIFHARLQAARVLLVEAWKLHPEYPEAAAQMIKVTLNLGGVAGESPRFWFDEAVKAEFDYNPAYSQYITSLTPRWGGSVPAMLNFGKECADTQRFDTLVPEYFDVIMRAMYMETGGSTAVYQVDEIYDTYRAVFDGYSGQSKDPVVKSQNQSRLACIAWLGRRMGEVRRICEELGPRFDAEVGRTYRVNPDEMRQVLETLTAETGGKFAGSRSSLSALALSRDGATLWSGTPDGDLMQWDVATGQQTSSLPRLAGGLNAIEISPAGDWLVAAGGEVRLYDTKDFNQPRTLEQTGRATSAAISADGKLLAVASISKDSSSRICLWKTDTQEVAATIDTLGMLVAALAFSPDGKQLTAARDWPSLQVNWETGDVVSYDVETLEMRDMSAYYQGKVTQLAYSRDGKKLALAGRRVTAGERSYSTTHLIRIVNLADGAGVDCGGHAAGIRRLRFVHDDRHLISCSNDGSIRIWDARSQTDAQNESYLFQGHATGVTALAVDGSEETLLSTDELGSILQWDISLDRLHWQIQADIGSYVFRGGVKELRRLPAEAGLAVASMVDGMSLWRSAEGFTHGRSHESRLDRRTMDADISPDGQTMAAVLRHYDGAGSLPLIDASEGRIIGQLEEHRGQPQAVRFSPDGKTVACADSERRVLLIDRETKKAWPWGILAEHAGVPGRLAFSADGRQLASGDDRGMVKVWRLPSDPTSQQAPLVSQRTMQIQAAVQCVAFSPDGKRLAMGSGKTQVWDLEAGRKLFELPGQEASFSPDSSMLVTGGGSLGAEAAVWDAASGKEKQRLTGIHAADLSCVLFYDAEHIVTGDLQGKLRCWDADSGAPIKQFAALISR
jgi:WD40 repeat protein